MAARADARVDSGANAAGVSPRGIGTSGDVINHAPATQSENAAAAQYGPDSDIAFLVGATASIATTCVCAYRSGK